PVVIIAPPPDDLIYTTHWSNDGTSSAGSEPIGAVTVPVSNGLFTVRLGDPSIVNMTSFSPGLFHRPDLKLRIWFNDGVNGFVLLNPAQPLTAAPYAMVANNASNLLSALPAAQISGPVASAQYASISGIASNAVSATSLTLPFSTNLNDPSALLD